MTSLALPCWQGFLRDSLGRFISIQQIHVGEYLGLGVVAALYLQAAGRPRRMRIGLVGLVAAVGFMDELMQLVLPQRVFDWSDVRLNWAGSLAGLFLVSTTAWLMRTLQLLAVRHAPQR